jgi:4-alpha-glucanotransferase
MLPLQDVLNLGSDARMNTPGKEGGNWIWRVRHEDVPDGAARGLRDLAEATARLPGARWEPR